MNVSAGNNFPLMDVVVWMNVKNASPIINAVVIFKYLRHFALFCMGLQKTKKESYFES